MQKTKISNLDAANGERGRRDALIGGRVKKGKKIETTGEGYPAVTRYFKITEIGRAISPNKDDKIKKVRSYKDIFKKNSPRPS